MNSFSQTPGGISSGLQFWIKANSDIYTDNGMTLANDGATIQEWHDQSSLGNNVSQLVATDRPTYRSSAVSHINYNPYVRFGNPTFLTRPDIWGGTLSEVTSFFAAYPEGYQGNCPIAFSFNLSGNTGRSSIHFPHLTGFISLDFSPEFNFDRVQGNVPFWTDYAGIGTSINSVLNGAFGISLNGKEYTGGSGPHTHNSVNQLTIGAALSGNNPALLDDIVHYDGRIPEVIVYDRAILGSERQRIETYLALKYGVTLDNTNGGTSGDYINSNNNTFWDASDNPSYHNDVIGIGRDDNSGLVQKQSHSKFDSTRIYLGNLAPINSLNNQTFSSDNSFVTLGHDNGMLCSSLASNAEMPIGLTNCPLFSRLEREYKLTKTNFSQPFNVDVKLNNCAIPIAINSNDLRVLIDDDGDFSNGGTVCYYNGDGTGIVISYSPQAISISNLSNTHFADNETKYFTIASVSNLTPLPTEVLYFKANEKGNSVLLNWETLTEIENDYFSIERSVDGLNWELLGHVNGAGNSSEPITYTQMDHSPHFGVSYYRLKQTNYNGTSKYSSIESVHFQGIQILSAYPNPANGETTIIINSSESLNVTAEIIDAFGRVILNESMTLKKGINVVKIDLSRFSSGKYNLKIQSDNEHYFDSKILSIQ